MEGKEGMNGFGVTVKGDEAPESYHVVARVENHSTSQVSGPIVAAEVAMTVGAEVAVPLPSVVAPLGKKRGRPRKYGPDGTVTKALSPMPISASIPLNGEFSGWKHGKARKVDSFKKKHKLEFASSGEQMAYSVGANFTTHAITVNAGEDVSMKILSFSQQGSRAICILAANGVISNVTLRQPNSCGGTLTHEGHFEILSLSGSFMPTDNGGTKGRTGGMSVSLAGPDGRVLGGGLAGLLIAAGPVQVVVGSFLLGHQQEQKPKKPRFESTTAFTLTTPIPFSGEGKDGVFGKFTSNITSPPSFKGVEAKDPGPPNGEVSC